jgi:hypothetical protein
MRAHTYSPYSRPAVARCSLVSSISRVIAARSGSTRCASGRSALAARVASSVAFHSASACIARRTSTTHSPGMSFFKAGCRRGAPFVAMRSRDARRRRPRRAEHEMARPSCRISRPRRDRDEAARGVPWEGRLPTDHERKFLSNSNVLRKKGSPQSRLGPPPRASRPGSEHSCGGTPSCRPPHPPAGVSRR